MCSVDCIAVADADSIVYTVALQLAFTQRTPYTNGYTHTLIAVGTIIDLHNSKRRARMGKAKKVTPGDWRAIYAHLPFKKRYSMATNVNKLKNYVGQWNVKLNGNDVGSAKVEKKTVEVKTQQGIQCFFLEPNR